MLQPNELTVVKNKNRLYNNTNVQNQMQNLTFVFHSTYKRRDFMYFTSGFKGKIFLLESSSYVSDESPNDSSLLILTDYQTVTARYAGSKQKIDSANIRFERSAYFDERSAKIWKSYRAAREGDYTLRSGFSNYGCYDAEIYQPLTSRQESLSEHSLGVMTLIRLIADFYPEVIDSDLLIRSLDFMRYHDLGETDYGDIPDNGNRNPNADANEFFCLCKKIAFLPNHRKESILKDFELFNLSNEQAKHLPLKDLVFQSLCKLADKADAILRGLVYESKGHTGRLLYVPRDIKSIGEQKYAAMMHDDSLVSIFTASFVDRHHTSFLFPLFFDIVRAAVIISRNEWFKNWEIVADKLNVTKEAFDLQALLSKFNLYDCYLSSQ